MKSLILAILTTTSILLAVPALALTVRLLPEKPQQGDTISVIIETELDAAQPTVSMNAQEYPVFPLSEKPGQYRALLPTTPLDTPGKLVIQVRDGETVKNLAVWLEDRDFLTQSIWLSGSGGQPATEIELARVSEFKKLVTPEKLWQGTFLRPSPAKVSALFGVQRYINGKFAQDYYHRGVDYAGAIGSPVFAPAAGRVALIGRESEGFRIHGNTIGIDHGQGVLSIFLHLDQILVKEGQMVATGEQIGTVGNTGASTGPHLHWGLYVNGVSVDPVPWRFEGFE
ncbi:M23 family metallopeptidase [Gloeocapsa sp. PCC 73106]|uniref:M23 family metallopeptidase n=1 Tax=Gloeocapsa sp. PCC 73106 TaxID=102232 RepID=UPI0002ABAB17|nr:M23 family metallopeptidase [Gloeocapsa sp. PCC 73106]ELR97936.1 metalloendopeptidase-like membrane protein [Gloeocapsa sp. PCC 73106]